MSVNLNEFAERNSSIGDINFDGNVNSIDARYCLRAVAKLESLNNEQKEVADVFGTGNINSLCARKILRVAAGIEKFDKIVEIQEGQVLVVDDIYTAGSGHYIWNCSFSAETMEYDVNYVISDDWGEPSEQIFNLYANNKGIYVVDFNLKAYEDIDAIDSFRVIINVV